MKIAGISKVRNESLIIQDTLEHYANLCNAGLYILDECSEDNTRELIAKHPSTKFLYEKNTYDEDRKLADSMNRKIILDICKKDNPDWIVIFDADERIEQFPTEDQLKGYDAVSMRLWDFYITPEDVDKRYSERKWIGPEYRDIINMVRNTEHVDYTYPDQRVPDFKGKVLQAGHMRHYGKAMSVEEWEKTCLHYMTWDEPYRSKWQARIGKAVHTKSDLGRDLITWEERELKGVSLL